MRKTLFFIFAAAMLSLNFAAPVSVCAQEQKQTHTKNEIILESKILFDISKSDITPQSAEILNEVIALLKLYPKNGIIIEGHADSSGEKKYNKTLSEGRARAVADFFIYNAIGAERISFYGLDASVPAESNETPEGRRQNRRAEIKIMRAEK